MRILLVDDDGIFLKGMMYLVRGLGHETLLASGGKEAVEILKQEDVDLVVSDINMPEGNGLQLLNWVKKNSDVPVILMTGLSDLNEAQRAIELGAESFLTKPFKKEELGEAIGAALRELPPTLAGEEKLDLLGLHIEEFLNGKDLRFPIYFKRDERVIKISAGAESLSAEVIQSCRESGIEVLYVQRGDYLQYLGMENFGSATVSTKVKDAWKSHVREELVPMNFLEALNPHVYRRSFLQIETLLDVICDNPKVLSLLGEMKAAPDFVRRSANVCFLSLLAAQYAKVLSAKELFNLGFAGLFHELGLLGTDQQVTATPVEELSPENREILWFHPLRGVERLRAAGNVPSEVLRLISEHHEDFRGKGYPESLSHRQLHRFTGILSVADAFALELEEKTLSEEVVIAELQNFIVKSLGRYETSVLEALSHVFNEPLPQEFIEFQLGQLNLESP